MNAKTGFCLILALLVVGLAIAMPGSLLEHRQHDLVDQTFITEAVNLSSEPTTLMDTLRTLADPFVAMEITGDEVPSEDILPKLNEQLSALQDLNIVFPFFHAQPISTDQIHSVSRMLFFGADRPVSVYQISTEHGLIWMDVQTEKIVKIHFYSKGNQGREYQEIVKKWKDAERTPAEELRAWASYYGLSAQPQQQADGVNDCDVVFFCGVLEEGSHAQTGFLSYYFADGADLGTATEFFRIEPFLLTEGSDISAK